MANKYTIATEKDRQWAQDFIAGLSIEGKKWELTIEPYRKRRTRSQNALYWAWVDEIARYVSEHTGYEKEDVHEYFKGRWLPPKLVELDGVTVNRYTTTGLDTAGMAEYTDKIYRWATTELGLILPLPPVKTEVRS